MARKPSKTEQAAPQATFTLPPVHPGYRYSPPRWIRLRCADGVVRECFDMDGSKLAEMAHLHLIGRPIKGRNP